MTREEYARHRGVSPQAISKAVLAGKIAYTTSGRRKMIDAAAADFALGEVVEDLAPAAPGGRRLESSSVSLTKARTESEIYRGKIAKLEYDRQIGALLEVAEVEASMSRAAAVIVHALELIPARAEDVAAAVASGGVAACREVLRTAVRDVRDRVHREMTVLSDEQLAADDDLEDDDEGPSTAAAERGAP